MADDTTQLRLSNSELNTTVKKALENEMEISLVE